MTEISVVLAEGDVVHLWLKAPPDTQGVVVLGPAGAAARLAPEPSDDFVRRVWTAGSAGAHVLRWDEAAVEVSLAYAFTPASVAEDGIRTLWDTARNRRPEGAPRLHFTPPWGWMNDPNGLCEAGGVLHLFYQHYPHARRWNTMHWGHAVTPGLVSWAEQPIFLLPRPELTASDARRGGAFSGSAVPLADRPGVRIFYTDRDDDRLPEREWQMTSASDAAVLEALPATPTITARPAVPGIRNDFRDPYVFRGPDGHWKMLLGSHDGSRALVLLYTTEDAAAVTGWRFVDVLYGTDAHGTGPAECPAMVALGGEGEGLWVLFVGLLRSRDAATGRRNLTQAITGRFDGERFTPIATRELDFGTDCYGFQACPSSQGPIGLGWAANWTAIDRSADFPSAMTFWRRILWRDGRLLTPPVDALVALRRERLDTPGDVPIEVRLPDGLAELELVPSTPAAPFTVALDHPSFHLALVYDGLTLQFVHDDGSGREGPRYTTAVDAIHDLRLFIDHGVIEAFANGGAQCCTRRIASEAPVQALRVDVPSGPPAGLAIWRLAPPERQRRFD